jgi:hypothetical protein
MQGIIKKLVGKPDGLYTVNNRCWRVARLFEECTPRREKVAQEAARLYRNGVYVGDCTIIYEVDKSLCDLVANTQKKGYIDSADSK